MDGGILQGAYYRVTADITGGQEPSTDGQGHHTVMVIITVMITHIDMGTAYGWGYLTQGPYISGHSILFEKELKDCFSNISTFKRSKLS